MSENRNCSGFLHRVLIGLCAAFPLVGTAAGPTVDGRAITFLDVPDTAWYAADVRRAVNQGIASGYKDAHGNPTGYFKPAGSVTLAEALKLAVNAAGYDLDRYPPLPHERNFRHWIAPYYRVTHAEGFAIFVGAFEDVDAPATRSEIARVVTDAFLPRDFLQGAWQHSLANPYADVDGREPTHWPILRLTADGILSGDTDANGQPRRRFRPNDRITRAEAMKVILKAAETYGMPGRGRPFLSDEATE